MECPVLKNNIDLLNLTWLTNLPTFHDFDMIIYNIFWTLIIHYNNTYFYLCCYYSFSDDAETNFKSDNWRNTVNLFAVIFRLKSAAMTLYDSSDKHINDIMEMKVPR
jgi:hypothetical protein